MTRDADNMLKRKVRGLVLNKIRQERRSQPLSENTILHRLGAVVEYTRLSRRA